MAADCTVPVLSGTHSTRPISEKTTYRFILRESGNISYSLFSSDFGDKRKLTFPYNHCTLYSQIIAQHEPLY